MAVSDPAGEPEHSPGRRVDVVLVAGGVWHDIDFARLELLKLLGEHEQIRVRCQADFEDTTWLEPGATHPARQGTPGGGVKGCREGAWRGAGGGRGVALIEPRLDRKVHGSDQG